jgi:DNA helicase-2/ATP-dependent DNA helicase PcrA
LAENVLDESGYMEMLKNDTSAEAPGRIENLKELINVMSDTTTYPNLREFLEHVSLIMDNDSAIDNNKVMLITLHSAKGLEFDTVFLPGWEEGLFPHQKSLDEGGSNSLEEERRLAYVAITRAKSHLYITLAHGRRLYGEWQNNLPSRFINEIPTECLQITNQASQCYNGGGSYNYNRYAKYHKKSSFNTKPSYQRYEKEYEYSYEADDYADYSSYQTGRTSSLIGLRVYHESFGYGSIISVEGQICVVDFDDFGRKKVMGTYLQRA